MFKYVCVSAFNSFLKDFIYFIFRQRGREGEREGEKYQCVVASQVPPTGGLACNQACAVTGNQTCDSVVLRLVLSPLSHTSQGSAFNSFEYILRSGIAGSYSNFTFRFSGKGSSVCPSCCTTLHSHQQCTRVPISSDPHQHVLSGLGFVCLFVCLNSSHPNGCEVVSPSGILNWVFCYLQPKIFLSSST